MYYIITYDCKCTYRVYVYMIVDVYYIHYLLTLLILRCACEVYDPYLI